MNCAFNTLSPDWNIPNVKAYTILSTDSDSNAVSFNRGSLSGNISREKLEQFIKPASPVLWLRQVHGCRIVELPMQVGAVCVNADPENIEADGSFTMQKNIVCAILTADCLPIVFAGQAGNKVGVAHAGRKGLQNGILSEMFRKLDISADEIYVWIGPGIAAESYPISREIREEVLLLSPAYKSVFTEREEGQYLMNLYEVAKMQLEWLGIPKDHITGAAWNTFPDRRFHSARRDKAQSGRMATVVWMK